MTADPRLATRLEELAEAPAPPMNVDVEHARRLGQRRLYTRRATLAAGVAAFAGAALATPSVLKAVTAPAPGPPTNPSPDPNPLIAYADFGWLPEPITRVEYGTGAQGNYTHVANEDDELGTYLSLIVHPAGGVPDLPREAQANVAAPPVNGRTAYWVTPNAVDPLNDGSAQLIWQVADGRWVRLTGQYRNTLPDPQDVLLRIAASVTVGERVLPWPVRIIGMPAAFRVTNATFYRPMPRAEGTGAWMLTLGYWLNVPAFWIQIHPEGSSKVANASSEYVRRTAKGIDVCVAGAEPSAVDAIGGAQGILDRITPLGMDEREWTTRPIS